MPPAVADDRWRCNASSLRHYDPQHFKCPSRVAGGRQKERRPRRISRPTKPPHHRAETVRRAICEAPPANHPLPALMRPTGDEDESRMAGGRWYDLIELMKII